MSRKRVRSKDRRKPREAGEGQDEEGLEREDALFRDAVRDVKPNEALAAKFDVRPEDVERARGIHDADAADAADAEVFEAAMQELDVELLERRASEDEIAERGRATAGGGLRARLARAAPRGEDRIDLHRMRRDEALAALGRFLRRVRERGGRVVVAVTGWGKHSDVDGPVLREAVEGWLRGPEGRELVAEHYPAPPEEGGRGAFYLFLTPKPRDAED